MKAIVFSLCVLASFAAVHGGWNVTTLNFATIALDVSFTSDTNGISAVGVNGSPAQIWGTTDGGVNFDNQLPCEEAGMFLGGETCGDGIGVVTDMFGLQASTTPNNWNFTRANLKEAITSQNVRALNSGNGKCLFGAAGNTISGGNGVAVSLDSAVTWEFYNISELVTSARYGAFPSATTWYISAGQWPDTSAFWAEKEGRPVFRQLSRRLHITVDARLKHTIAARPAVKLPGDDNGWVAQIAKTTDGGQTWTSVFLDQGNFYFNQISCWDENNCIAIGEADTSPVPGVRLVLTTDGGKTWNTTLLTNDPAASGMSVEWIGQKEIWAGGGLMDSAKMAGYFWHSVDGGQTWDLEEAKYVYAADMSFPDNTHGYAVGPNILQQSAFMTYTA